MTDKAPIRNNGFPLLPGELKLRFGCGMIVGIGSGFMMAVRWTPHPTTLRVLLWTVGGALVFGAAAALGGDRFWRSLGRWHWWH